MLLPGLAELRPPGPCPGHGNAALGIPVVPYQAESLAPLGCCDSSQWTLAWAVVTEHLQNALPPDANPLAAVGPLTGTAPWGQGSLCAQPGAQCHSQSSPVQALRLGHCGQLFL